MNRPRTVTLFIQCLVDGLYPEIGRSMVRVLRNLGLALDCPTDQTCCGQPAFNAGYRAEARTAARRFIEIFGEAEAVVCPSGSCVAMVRHHYAQLFADEPLWLARARAVAARTWEFSEFLVDVLGVTDVGARYAGRVTYHDSCHLLRTLRVSRQPRRLIEAVEGAEFVEMAESERCCGFGGGFAVKYPDISGAMVDHKIGRILESGADTVVGCDTGCLMNIQGRLHRGGKPVRVLHIAQLLDGGRAEESAG